MSSVLCEGSDPVKRARRSRRARRASERCRSRTVFSACAGAGRVKISFALSTISEATEFHSSSVVGLVQ
eukprot:3178014-Pyramimonas_sp.AAC.1